MEYFMILDFFSSGMSYLVAGAYIIWEKFSPYEQMLLVLLLITFPFVFFVSARKYAAETFLAFTVWVSVVIGGIICYISVLGLAKGGHRFAVFLLEIVAMLISLVILAAVAFAMVEAIVYIFPEILSMRFIDLFFYFSILMVIGVGLIAYFFPSASPEVAQASVSRRKGPR